jgi:hypothetical protein
MSKKWTVLCEGRQIGTVREDNLTLARCAALSKFGVADEDLDAMGPREGDDVCNFGIPPGADFDVIPA